MMKKTNFAIALITPFLLVILCGAIAFLCIMIPSQKINKLLNLAFMDNIQTSPDETSGLKITNDDIDLEYSGKTYKNGEIDVPSFGEQYAVLVCKNADMKVPVYWGSTDELLEKGACQASFSPVIGDTGNVVIDAHVNTYFENLSKINEGDEVILYTEYGRFTYKVNKKISFMKTDKSYVNPKTSDVLTLYTCKKDILGSSDARCGVTCELEKKEFYKEKQEQK